MDLDVFELASLVPLHLLITITLIVLKKKNKLNDFVTVGQREFTTFDLGETLANQHHSVDLRW